MLTFDRTHRLSAIDALNHPFLNNAQSDAKITVSEIKSITGCCPTRLPIHITKKKRTIFGSILMVIGTVCMILL